MANYEDFSIDQGADVAIEMHLKEADGSVKDLTGYTVASKMKRNYNSGADDTVEFTCTIQDPKSNGIVILALTNIQTDALNTSGRYVYDVELSFNDENGVTIIERILEGKIKVNPSVTR
jgi:hypothetical protein